MSYQPIIAFPNRALNATFSGGSYTVNFPLSNLGNRELSRVARSSNLLLASTQFDVDLGALHGTKVIALIGHNLTLNAARVRIRGNETNSFTAPTLDTDWFDVWPVVYPYEVLEWEDDNWWQGGYLPEEVSGFVFTLVYVLPTSLALRYFRIEFNDQTNADGYVQAGQVFIAGQWQASYGFAEGATLGWNVETLVETALGGAEYFDERTPYRVFQFRIEHLQSDEAHGRALELMRRAGISLDVFIIPDPDDSVNMLRRAFIGRLRQLSPIEYPYLDRNHTAWEIKEKVA